MFFNLIDQNAVGCWDTATPYTPQNHGIVDRDDDALVFPADVKVDETNTVWVISDRMPVFLIAELDYTDINFRIFSAPLDSLTQGTVCAKRPFNRFNPISTPIIPAAPKQSAPYNYLGDYSTETFSDEALSPGYPDTTQLLGYNAAPRTIPTTQLPTTPKAFVYNQHNGVTLKTETPAYYNFYPHQQSGSNYYQRPRSQQPQSSYQKKNEWPNHQYYY